MHLKRFTDLGLRILMHLANEADPETPHSVPELSRFLCWNQNLVIKTANAMVKAGWLSAVRGRHGGLRLACKPEDLRIGDAHSKTMTCSSTATSRPVPLPADAC